MTLFLRMPLNRKRSSVVCFFFMGETLALLPLRIRSTLFRMSTTYQLLEVDESGNIPVWISFYNLLD